MQVTLRYVGGVEADQSAPLDVVRALKGLAFVQLYAIYEYAVVQSVIAANRTVSSHKIAHSALRHSLLPLALDSECKSLADCGPSREWDVRRGLMAGSRASDPAAITDTLFPSDGSHFRRRQLNTIWELFGLDSSIVPEPRLLGRIDELVEKRNSVAHGRESAESVGARFSLSDLEARLVDIATVCRHVIESLDSHVSEPRNLAG